MRSSGTLPSSAPPVGLAKSRRCCSRCRLAGQQTSGSTACGGTRAYVCPTRSDRSIQGHGAADQGHVPDPAQCGVSS